MKDWIVTWLKAARAPFLIVSFIPAVLGGIIAYYHGAFDWTIFILATVGAVMAQSAADFIDDYFDYKNGNLGNKEQQFHDSPLISGKITTGQVMFAFLLCLGIAVGIGIYLLIEVGLPVLYLMAAGAFIVLFYTSPPIRLNYRGLGETMLFIAFGPMIVFGVYFVLTGEFSIEPLLASIPLGIFIMNVGIVSNTFDHDDDVKSGKRSLPVRFGQANAVKVLTIVTFLAYATVVISVILDIMPYWTLIGLLSLPVAIQVIKATSKFENTDNYTPAMSKAIALSSIMGVMLIAGYAIGVIV